MTFRAVWYNKARGSKIGALDRQHTGVALLHDVGCCIAVFDRAGAEVQQFSVVVLEHGSAMARGKEDFPLTGWRRDVAVADPVRASKWEFFSLWLIWGQTTGHRAWRWAWSELAL